MEEVKNKKGTGEKLGTQEEEELKEKEMKNKRKAEELGFGEEE